MPSEDVSKAERVIAELRGKREAMIAHATEVANERSALAYAAHAGDDSKARGRLNEINRELAVHDSELRSLDAAIAEASKRLEAARQAEALAADRKLAAEARKIAAEVGERFRRADKHLSDALKELLEA